MKVILNRVNQDYLFEVKNQNGHKVVLDNISKKEGKVAGVSPMELLLVALAGCSSIDILAILKKQKINPTNLRVEVEGQREPDQVPSLFHKIDVVVHMAGGITPPKAQKTPPNLKKLKQIHKQHKKTKKKRNFPFMWFNRLENSLLSKSSSACLSNDFKEFIRSS